MTRRIITLCLSIVMLLTLCSCAKKELTWQEQYDLGEKYLSEGNFEDAALAFAAAIKIDPNNTEAYAKAIEAYIGMGDAEGALELMKLLSNLTEDEEAKVFFDSLIPAVEENMDEFSALFGEVMDTAGDEIMGEIAGELAGLAGMLGK